MSAQLTYTSCGSIDGMSMMVVVAQHAAEPVDGRSIIGIASWSHRASEREVARRRPTHMDGAYGYRE